MVLTIPDQRADGADGNLRIVQRTGMSNLRSLAALILPERTQNALPNFATNCFGAKGHVSTALARDFHRKKRLSHR
jgi:hypothetical protein